MKAQETTQRVLKLIELSLEMLREDGTAYLTSDPDADSAGVAKSAARDIQLWGQEVYDLAVAVLRDVPPSRKESDHV